MMSIIYFLILVASMTPGPERLYATDTSHSPDEIDAHFAKEKQKGILRKALKPFRCHYFQ